MLLFKYEFRTIFSIIANEFIDDDNAHGVSRDIIEFQLAHQIDNKVGSAYNKLDLWNGGVIIWID
jgi:hypothetical protein